MSGMQHAFFSNIFFESFQLLTCHDSFVPFRPTRRLWPAILLGLIACGSYQVRLDVGHAAVHAQALGICQYPMNSRI